MRIRISHETAYSYEQPVRSLMQALRVMPRDHEGQVVVSWRIEPSIDGRLRSTEDAFGNLVHDFQADGPFDAFALRIDGVIETTDMTGFVRGAPDPLPAEIFLRGTPRSHADEAIQLFARKLARGGQSPLELLHALMQAVFDEIRREEKHADEPTRAETAFALRSGTSVDLAHIFAAAARELGLPTRVVSGYLANTDGGDETARHAWCETLVDGFGWIGFDPTLNLCPTERHVRVAVGLDHDDCSPMRLTRIGGGGETARTVLNVRAVDQ